ncbi:GH32 C-terminal domain-containing protein [Martelella mediterranea]|uniref:beta-fructofuranosidase n=1 Tax=Martelella mediterranea TaxID=293089 RepID=A0A4R3NXD7_9HYPH|nr:GH32 C-terminal domain-containing protein [Martelella mediterranea]TCT45054.1 beta-fructofuranosidase [Martelella mediterranea]
MTLPEPRTTDDTHLRKLRGTVPVNAVLHVWLKAIHPHAPGEMQLSLNDQRFGNIFVQNSEEYEFRMFFMPHGGELECAYDPETTTISVAYWFTDASVLEEGITVLRTHAANAPAPAPGSYHFRPPFGWMNDPNGFGRFNGSAHLFYQHYSHGLTWNTMHWGHAISEDFLHWRHLPIFLFPSEDLTHRPDKRGGAFSGSAIPLDNSNGIRVFFTEHVIERAPEREIQMMATSQSLIFAGAAKPLIDKRPELEGLTLDFRDPYVFRGPDGYWKMLLGSRLGEDGVVLLYQTSDVTASGDWEFVDVLHSENRFNTQVIECPCLLPLDGPAGDPTTRWVLICGLMHSHHEETGRKNLSLATVGHFDGKSFTPEFEQELDFIVDNYAFQAFLDSGTPVGIGWLANWADAAPEIDFPTAMTLPRNLVYDQEDETLLTPPIEGVETLRDHLIDEETLASGEAVMLETGQVEIVIELDDPGAPFELDFYHNNIEMMVQVDQEGLRFVYHDDTQGPSPDYVAPGAKPSHIRVFLDIGSVEVFADNGRWAGTKRIAGFDPVHSIRIREGRVKSAKVWGLAL